LGWGFRSSDEVSHFLGGTRHGRCVRVMTRGFEMCVLHGVNVCSLPSSRCESFAGVRCTGFADRDYLWDLSLVGSLVMGNLMGRRFGWVVDGFFLGGTGEGKRNSRSRTTVCFRRTTRGSKQSFLCYILYIEEWEFRWSMTSDHREWYFCYMFSLGTSGSTSSVRIYRSACEHYTPNIYRCIPT
jgi:hypothetical protein